MISNIKLRFQTARPRLYLELLFVLMITILALLLYQLIRKVEATPLYSYREIPKGQTTLYLPLILTAPEPIFIYLPFISRSRSETPFGIESTSFLINNNNNNILLERTSDLGVTWVRLPRIKWSELQPNEDDPIDWDKLITFEKELDGLKDKLLKPIITITSTPRWASIEPSSCSAIREEHLKDFADFMEAIVSRYSPPPFDVKHWELWNEPDIDPSLIGIDSIFGCWGDKDEHFYGGEYYGYMLKNVASKIRSVDPDAKIIIGGLLLDLPDTSANGNRRELFFEGILAAGAAPYFDFVAYHNHSGYFSPTVDYSGPSFGPWAEYLNENGEPLGPAKGKPHFLRATMARYGVDKPLFLDESAQRCPPSWSEQCYNPPDEFFAHQPVFLTRMAIRSLNAGVQNYIWYTIHGPSWEYVGLLDGSNNPRAVYYAYQTMVQQIGTAAMNAPLQVDSDYPAGIEAYRFREHGQFIDALWSVDGTPITLSVSEANYISASDHLGTILQPTRDNGQFLLSVGIHTIYIHRRP